MCTAVGLNDSDFYFGRTLDYPHSYQEEVTIVPGRYALPFRNSCSMKSHYAILGMAWTPEEYPLLYDGINEKGLAMAGLNFVGNACYSDPMPGRDNVAHFELIPWILGQCADLEEARRCLKSVCITSQAYREDIPCAWLHWIIADGTGSITVESTHEGIYVYDNPVGVLTNNPQFPYHMEYLNQYLGLSVREPESTFAKDLRLKPDSHGMGALGLPGDYSSRSRFVRTAFLAHNSIHAQTEGERVHQFFHILGAVEQPKGSCVWNDGSLEHTVYTSCCNATQGIYYYTTYNNRRITGIKLTDHDLGGSFLIRYPLQTTPCISFQKITDPR